MTTFYKNINVTIPYLYMKFVVGKNGYNFKKCKSKYNVDSVWFNTKRNIVEIYGNQTNIDEAGLYIENLIEKVKRFKIPNDSLNNFKLPDINHDKYIEGSLHGALDKTQVKYLIGKKGTHFKRITRECEVSFIWYDENKHSICIWGPESKLENTVNSLYILINEVKNKSNQINNNDMETD